MPFVDIRKRHIQAVIDSSNLSYGSKQRMKVLCNQLFKYALNQEIVSTNFAALVEMPENKQRKNEYLEIKGDKAISTYQQLKKLWYRTAQLAEHLPHDGRHTCATLLDNAEVPLKISQLILGHTSQDITNRVYNHKTIQQLIDAIDKI